MKNVTITLKEDVAAWLRVEAAKAGKSVSRYICDLLSERRGRGSQINDLERFLSGPDYAGIATNRPSREELYAERLFRRHKRAAVPDRSHAPSKTKTGSRVARRARSS